jgi:hypothetical protein
MLPTKVLISDERSCLRLRLFHLPLILAGMLLSIAARAQVTYTGATANQNFGSQAVGSSVTRTFTFSVAAGTSVNGGGVSTQGEGGYDFNSPSGGTCAWGHYYSSATTCTVNVTFTPLYAGLRMGAVLFTGLNAYNFPTQLGVVMIYGVGTGAAPQIAFNPSPAQAIEPIVNGFTSYLDSPNGVTFGGGLYVADTGDSRVLQVTTEVTNGFFANVIDPGITPFRMTMDGAGDLYVSNPESNSVVDLPVASSGASNPSRAFGTSNIDPTVNGKSLSYPTALAVDGAGNLFIVDANNTRVVEVPAGGGAAIAIDPTVDGKPLDYPGGVAVDGAGDLFIADSSAGRVVKVPAGGGTAVAIHPTVDGESLADPGGLAVDGVGDLFIADSSNGRIVEVPSGGGAAAAIYPTETGFEDVFPIDVAVDSSGDIVFADAHNSQVVELQRSLPPALSFATPTFVGTTDTTDGRQIVQIQNTGDKPLKLTAISYPADFPEASGDANPCTGSTSLGPGAMCDLSVDFTPKSAGPLSENITLTDNAVNVSAAQQSIAVTGTGLSVPALSSPTPGSTLSGPNVTFTWTPSPGITQFELWLSFNGAGSSDLFNSGVTTSTSATATNLPTQGATIYARLFFEVGNVWSHLDYTYTEASTAAAVLTSPTPGSTLGATNINFTWSAGAFENQYELWLGYAGPGSSDLYNSGLTTALSATVPTLPTTGATVYARLFSKNGNNWSYNDYTFTEGASTAAVLTSPTPGTALGATDIQFTWTAGTNENQYQLWLGLTGPGSSDLFASGLTTALSATVPSLPAHGSTIYARLFSKTGNNWSHNDYTFTEP